MSATVTADRPRAAVNREAMLERIAELDELRAEVRAGGGERYVERHRRRGKLLARERVELLIDRDSPLLELGVYIAAGTKFHPGGSVVCAIGVVESVECMIIAHDPTVRGGSINPFSLRKILRALEIAERNRLPVVNLVESAGADLPSQLDSFIPAGQLFRDLTRLSAQGIPTIAIVFGNSTAGGAYVPGMCDYTVLVRGSAKVFLGGPPLVKMATGETATDEELGGGDMHATVSGLSDYLAVDEPDAIRLCRQVVRGLDWPSQGPAPRHAVEQPHHDPEELLDVVSADLRVPFDPREVIVRIVDGSRYDEFKPLYGGALTTGWARIHGHPVGILANVRGVLFPQEAQKATHFIQLANQLDRPLIFLHNTTGFMVGREYERAGIIKEGAKMINAVSNSRVPHYGVVLGASYGAANYAMSGRAYAPRLLFSWPTAASSVMGPDQLAGVLSLVARQAAESAGREFDETEAAVAHEAVRSQIQAEQTALAISAMGYDDGIIDPRDTRSVLGLSLSACAAPQRDATGFGVFRM
jgi:acyl-CoA carboxylase subunit beta